MTQTNRKSAPCLSHLKVETGKKKGEVWEAAERGERVGVR